MRPAFLTTAETLALLVISERTFRREYQRLFTDGRPVHRRKRRVPLAFRRAEVEGVVEHGWEWLAAERRRKLTK